MARVFSEREIVATIQNAETLLKQVKATVQAAEQAVARAVKIGHAPADVNDIGRDRYAQAGRLLAQAIDELEVLGADGTDGLAWPAIAAIGSPREFDLLQVDLTGGGPWTAIFTAKNYRAEGSVNPNPWSGLSVGDVVEVKEINMQGSGIGDDVQGHVGGVAEIDQDGSGNWFLRLDNDLKNAVSADPGEEKRNPKFTIRVIDDGS